MSTTITMSLRLDTWTDAQQMGGVLGQFDHILDELNDAVEHKRLTGREALQDLGDAVQSITKGLGESRTDSVHPRLKIIIDTRE